MPISLLLDENLPFALIGALEERGCTVHHIKKLGKAGIKNGEVYRLAEDMDAWIVTRDADFQGLERFLRSSLRGIIVIKQHDVRTPVLLSTMNDLFSHHISLFSTSCVIVVNDEELRVFQRSPTR